MTNPEDPWALHLRAMSSFIVTVKLLVTLASGVLALSGTFADKLVAPAWALAILYVSWIGLILSILFGILALYSIADSQHSARRNWWGLANPRIKRCYRMFLGGVSLMVVYAAIGSGMRVAGPRVQESTVIELRGPIEIKCPGISNATDSGFVPPHAASEASAPDKAQPIVSDSDSI